MKNICVVHLVREANDLDCFRRFLDSYQVHPGGVDHDLLILFKGFNTAEQKAPYLALLENVRHATFDVSDDGFDINAYMKVTEQYAAQYRYFCFLNSHCIILDSEWLVKLYNNILLEGVGLVGATGSWQSHRGSPPLSKMVLAIVVICSRVLISRVKITLKIEYIREVLKEFAYLMNYDRFPNVHVRTNAFMISSQAINAISNYKILTKKDAYKYESGKRGLSKSILRAKKRLLIVGRDGIGYEPAEWDSSHIYWSGNQDNLLVSDNVTRQYEFGTLEVRNKLSKIAWISNYSLALFEHWDNLFNSKRFAEKIRRQQERLLEIDNGAQSTSVRLVIYGAGVLGDFFDKWVHVNTLNFTVTAFVDTYKTASVYNGTNVFSPHHLVENVATYDYIVISSNKFYKEIYDQLLLMKLDMSKVI